MPSLLFAILLFGAPETMLNLSQYTGEPQLAFGIFGFKSFLILFILLSSFLFPASFIYYLYTIKLIPSLLLEQRESRQLPYLITALLYMALAYMFYKKLPDLVELPICFASISLSILLVWIINFRWKISAHATGAGGVLAGLFALSIVRKTDSLLIFIIIFIILTGLICAARLRLNAHSPWQIIAGLALGFVCGLSSTLFL